jgi:membrane associated rhomboid family serine protease
MFPIGDENVPTRGFPFVNYALILVNVLAFLYEISLGQNTLQDFVTRWGVVPANIQAGTGYITLLTSMFLHGSWLHLLGNMVFLWVFGDNVEAVFGHIGYLIFYMLGGLAASFTHIFFNMGSGVPSIGASGAIAAVLGAYIIMFPRARVRLLVLAFGFWVTRVSAIIFLGIWFLTQLFSGVTSIGVNTAQTDGVAVWAHVGGFLFGILAGLLMRNRAVSFGNV